MVQYLNFVKEVKAEALRIVWPTKKEAWQSVLLVLGSVVIASLFFLAADALLYKLVKLILG